MFIATLFVIAQSWKRPKYPSTGERSMCKHKHLLPPICQVSGLYNLNCGVRNYNSVYFWGEKKAATAGARGRHLSYCSVFLSKSWQLGEFTSEIY